MKTLWQKHGDLDQDVANFTVGDDRETDVHLARQDVLGSLAHVRVLEAAKVLSSSETAALTSSLVDLYALAERGELVPGSEDEDIHSTIERLLTEQLGETGKRIHTARSRNDQIATDVALWIREQALEIHGEAISTAKAIMVFAEENASVLMPGLTHLQPAMPSSFGLWAAGWASLLLDDVVTVRSVFDATDACPLGSAAGYGIPAEIVPIDRNLSADLLGFDRPAEPVTAVQCGRGKAESAVLFAMNQVTTTCARLAQDVVLFSHPTFGFLELPRSCTTGSSIMPQKRNPDVMELVRGHSQTVRAALLEVLGLAGSVAGGYHRDFQLLKAPLIRGITKGRAVLRIVAQVFPRLIVHRKKAHEACEPTIYSTHRALQLVTDGMPFRDAYAQVSRELNDGEVVANTNYSPPSITSASMQIQQRLVGEPEWHQAHRQRIERAYADLLSRS